MVIDPLQESHYKSGEIANEDKELDDLVLEECTAIVDQESNASDNSGDDEYVCDSGGEEEMDIPVADTTYNCNRSCPSSRSSVR